MSSDKWVIHPLVVHFPIALCFFEVFLLGVARFKKDAGYLRFARFTFHTLAVCLVVTLAAGWRDAGGSVADLFEGGVEPHFFSACAFTLIVLVRLALWRRFQPDHPKCFAVQFAGSLLMAAAVIVTAYFGGQLVYS